MQIHSYQRPAIRSTSPRFFLLRLLSFICFVIALIGIPGSPSLPSAHAEAMPITAQLNGTHPRLLATQSDFDRLRSELASEPYQSWYQELTQKAQPVLTAPPSTYAKNPNLLPTSRTVLSRVLLLAMLYQLDGDTVYVNRAWQELETAANFSDWNPDHFLDTAEMTYAFAIGYDWMYNAWTETQRNTLRTAILTKGLNPGIEAYRGTATPPTYDRQGWVDSTNNWNFVCNGGLSLGALAIGDVPEGRAAAEEVLREGIERLPNALERFAPDGAWDEGVSYWGYATTYLTAHLSALQTALGNDYGLSQSPGLSDTGLLPIALTGSFNQSFNFGDAESSEPTSMPQLFWLDTQYDRPEYVWWRKQRTGDNVQPNDLLWYTPNNYAGPRAINFPQEQYFRNAEIATMRSAWEDPKALYVALKGSSGNPDQSHADLDAGTFVFDALGVRWADEMGLDNYGLPGYFSYGPNGQRWTYYRKRAEGQNTFVINPDTTQDQNIAVSHITSQDSSPLAAYTITDLTPAYEGRATQAQRGIKLFNHRRHMLVQDEIQIDNSADGWWFMHTRARVQVSDDGQSAMLYSGEQRMWVRILSPAEATLRVLDPKPLPSSPDPAGQAQNTGRKLAIKLTDTTDTRIAVLFVPLRSWESPPDTLPEITPLADWQVPANPPVLANIHIDEVPLTNFAPSVFTYDTLLPVGTTQVPTVSATPGEESTDVQIQQATTLPGTTSMMVTASDGTSTRYLLHFDVAKPLLTPIAVTEVIASTTDADNIPSNTLDDNLDTRWSSEGTGEWIRYDLGSIKQVQSVAMAWFRGDQRQSFFDIQISDDATNWATVFSGATSGETNEQEFYSIGDVPTRYIRIVGQGNTQNPFNSITEVDIYNQYDAPTPLPATLQDVTIEAASPSMPVGGETQLTVAATLSNRSPVDLSQTTIHYESNDTAVGQVSPTGELRAIGEGSAKITAWVELDNYLDYASMTITVTDPYTSRLMPSADATVRDGSFADTNYGNDTGLTIKTSPDSGFTREVHIQFDISTVDQEVESATLYMYGSVQDSRGTDTILSIAGTDDDWSEDEVTWNNRPNVGAELTTLPVNAVGQFWAIDITDYVKQQRNNDQTVSMVVREVSGGIGLAFQATSLESTDNQSYLLIKTAPPQQTVRPLLECVQPQQDGSYTAYFGYRNDNHTATDIPIGKHNRFSPEPQERGQPTAFQPGRTAYYPDAAFQVVFDGSPLVWTLNGRTVTASNNPAQVCS
ncbi:MAG: hypothetical protein GFH27_549305n137 [Chloroflexi bacterium AL-W]|nr:hypothetical protein [Chloroflexi bacterium AL-N1]NOK69383.1 hypothetical protein [Chloroflexi bacterium AL-N10]NOK76444.1 hypothetical protein [Chloroflexi bacterium AL-N5]NOK83561.1 hypothetical protein [Chloroflexi bacterium AL-W]NOK91221.1 hypothetical protein [Chloroflexi bacterium AL-N15]